MAPHKTVTINGHQYDAITGLPVVDKTPVAPASITTPTSEAAPTTAPISTATSPVQTSASPVVDATTPTAVVATVAKATASASASTVTKPAVATPTVPQPKRVGTPVQQRATAKTVNSYRQDVSMTKKPLTSNAVHDSKLQHSQTLNRRATRRPEVGGRSSQRTTSGAEATTTTANTITNFKKSGRQMDIARSQRVTRFAKDPAITKPASSAAKSVTTTAATAKSGNVADIPAKTHPIAQKAVAKTSHKNKVAAKHAPKTAKEVKDQVIEKALATPATKPKTSKKKSLKKHFGKRKLSTRSRIVVGVIAAAIAILAVCFIVYRFVPTVSVSVASAHAGIDATYPEYTPDGYSLYQPVNYSDGTVILKFASNSNDNYYTIKQTRSSWDSTAVLDNIVTPAAQDDYVTTKERGLTIYTYDSIATWVNGGILYTVDSKAQLSGEQIRRIATSL